MKGKNKFTIAEIGELRQLIRQRISADRSKQKSIRRRMRDIGFYGKDDFGITDLHPADFENLINSGLIIVLGENEDIKPVLKPLADEIKTMETENSIGDLEFRKFDPQCDSPVNIPNSPGNYIVCLKAGSSLPGSGHECAMLRFNSLEVIYTGIAGKSLRSRDYKQHFAGNNAGSSTLRKSLGSLSGFKKIPRDKDPSTGKTKFSVNDEIRLSLWMKENLILFFATSSYPEKYEIQLINRYNPPLNLSKNRNGINKVFRDNLSKLRSVR